LGNTAEEILFATIGRRRRGTMNKIACGLVVIASLAAVCWLRFNGMNGLLWFPITIELIATFGLRD
jgi:CHASE2 domain-containing sensor protein